MSCLRQQLLRSLSLEGVKPVLATVRLPDRRYCELHLKSARGSITPEEDAELDLLIAMKVEAEQ